MSTIEALLLREKRILWLDNLRSFTIFLVVLYHVGGVYESAGSWGWFWIVDDPDTISWVGIIGIVLDIFIMPMMFFISGFLAPISLDNKTGWQFFKRKFNRLMFPWLIAVFTLIPLYRAIFLFSRDLPQGHWTTYFQVSNPNSQNWLWFLPLLFAFNILYWLISKIHIRIPQLAFRKTVLGNFMIGVSYSYITGSILGPKGWVINPTIDFEHERLLLYFMTFLFGAFCFRKKLFEARSKSKKSFIIIGLVALLPVTVHVLIRLYPIFYPVNISNTPLYMIVWWLSFYLSLICIMYLMIETFRRYLDRSGTFWLEMARNSYGVYLVHVIMIGVFGTLLMKLDLPSLLKYPSLVVLSYLGSNLFISFYQSIRYSLKPTYNQLISKAVDLG